MNTNNWKRNFFTIWTGQGISLITSSALQMAIIWHLTNTTGSAMVLSLATMAGFLPQALLGTMIGVLVDRWNRKFVMIGADLIIAAAGLSLAVLSLASELPVWAVLLVLLVRSIGTAFHAPAISAVTPLLVPESHLTKCAGYSQSVQSVSYISGPAIAAFIYAQWGLNAAVILDVAGAAAACITVAMVAIPKQRTETVHGGSFLSEMKEGYNVIRKNKMLLSLLWVGVFYSFIYMPVNALFPLMSMDYFGGSTMHASAAEIMFAVGMLAGGLLLGAWGGFQNRIASIVFSIALMGGALLVSGLLPIEGFIIFGFCCLLMGFSVPFYNGIQMALFQEKIQPEYLGRVFGLLGSVMSLAMPLGLIVSGIFADRVGVNVWFALSSVGILLIAAVSAFLPSLRKQIST